MKKWSLVGLLLLLLAGGGYLFRQPLLRSFATFLICEDPLQKADALFVLSGGGYDRGNEAAKVFEEGYAPKIICTGGNEVVEFKVFNIDTLESDLTVANLKRQQVPDSVIVEIREGTSTKEEASIILNYCKSHQLQTVIVLSSKLHTHRINEVFRKPLKEVGVQLIVHGAPNSRFDEMLWWQSEDGLIAINNEWLKTFYYWWKY